MEFQIKSKSAKRLLEQLDGFDQIAFSERIEKENLGNMVIAEGLLLGYLESFFTIITGRGIVLDMTYETLDRLSNAIGELFIFQRMSDAYKNDHAKNVASVQKTLAAYLTVLAMNQHGYSMRVKDYLDDLRKGKHPQQPLWAEMFSIMTGAHGDVDMLPACTLAEDRSHGYDAEKGLYLNAAPIVEVYQYMTGVNLTKYGFRSFAVR